MKPNLDITVLETFLNQKFWFLFVNAECVHASSDRVEIRRTVYSYKAHIDLFWFAKLSREPFDRLKFEV